MIPRITGPIAGTIGAPDVDRVHDAGDAGQGPGATIPDYGFLCRLYIHGACTAMNIYDAAIASSITLFFLFTGRYRIRRESHGGSARDAAW